MLGKFVIVITLDTRGSFFTSIFFCLMEYYNLIIRLTDVTQSYSTEVMTISLKQSWANTRIQYDTPTSGTNMTMPKGVSGHNTACKYRACSPHEPLQQTMPSANVNSHWIRRSGPL